MTEPQDKKGEELKKEQEDKAKDADNHRRMIEIARKFGYKFPDKKPEDVTSMELRYLWEAVHQVKRKYGVSLNEANPEQKSYLERVLDAVEKINKIEKAEPSHKEAGEARRTATDYELGRRRRIESFGRRRRY